MQTSEPAPNSALRLAKQIHLALGFSTETKAGTIQPGGLDLESMPLNDALMLVHVLGRIATTSRDQDVPVRIGNPSFPFAIADPPQNVRSASERIEAALALLDSWPSAFQSLLEKIALRFPHSGDQRQDKRVFGSRVGKWLLYLPCDLSGRPLPPIHKEVYAFCHKRRGLKLSKRRYHTVDGLARRIYAGTNLSSLSRSLGVPSNDGLLNQISRRVLGNLCEEECGLPVDDLSSVVEARVHSLYRDRLSSLSATAAANILEGATHDTTLTGWDHPSLLTPLTHVDGLGKARVRSYAAAEVEGLRLRLAKLSRRTGAFDRMIPLRARGIRGKLGMYYNKTDLLIDVFEGRLPIYSVQAEPRLSDLWVIEEDIAKCQADAFAKQAVGSNAYHSWSTICKKMATCHPEVARVDQWTLNRLATQGKINRRRSPSSRKWQYCVADVLSLLGHTGLAKDQPN